MAVVRSQIEKHLNDIHYNIKRKDIDKIIEIILSEIISALKRGEPCEIRGVGRWATKLQKAKISRNPKNGLPVKVPSKRKIRFKASKTLLKELNKNFTASKISDI
jgi:integration host factor subunit beta